jgi:transcriptional regulator with XRE-family HTH domain
MQVNAARVVEFRNKSSWSQDELATAAGLNLRTIQRVENTGTASLQTMKAIAAALEAELDDFKIKPETQMAKYEYKTVVMPFKMGLVSPGLPDIAASLNSEARSGWRLREILPQTNASGQTYGAVAIMERPLT